MPFADIGCVVSLTDELGNLADDADDDATTRRTAKLRRDNNQLRRQLETAELRALDLEQALEFHNATAAADLEPPQWLTPKKPKSGHRATLVAMLSDCHFDEVVSPDELGGLNAYDRAPAHGYRIWNLGNNKPVSLRDMIAAIEQVVGRAAQIDHKPMQPGDVELTCADISRSTRELAYQPRTSFHEGLARQWSWMRSLGN